MTIYDIACIGAGPANLSVAALGQHSTTLKMIVLEKEPEVSWHPYALYDESNLQTSCLEDLVTPVMPTNPLSFLNFLSNTGRITQFLCASDVVVSRREWEQYLQWCSKRIENLHTNEEVQEVGIRDSLFVIRSSVGEYFAKNISLGIGVVPHTPEWAKEHIGKRVFHAWDLTKHRPNLSGCRVVVVGGGQTSAEVVDSILNDTYGRVGHLFWASRRKNLIPMDDTPFVNEFFSPQYAHYFNSLDDEARHKIEAENRLLCDGVSPGMAGSLYNKIYFRQHVEESGPEIDIILGQDVEKLSFDGSAYTIHIVSNIDGNRATMSADIVILATGCERHFPPFLSEIKERFVLNKLGEFELDRNYRAKTHSADSPGLYAHNRGRRTHGIGDNTFCMISWRSATVLNAITREEIFRSPPTRTAINWLFGREELLEAAQ